MVFACLSSEVDPVDLVLKSDEIYAAFLSTIIGKILKYYIV